MKYYTIEIKTVNGTTTAQMLERTDRTAAISAYYSIMASAVATPNCTYAYTEVKNSAGGVEISGSWAAEIEVHPQEV